MNRTIVAALLLAATACVADVPDTASDATWVGSITTEGNTTTVINESGSVWGGTARLVEEASIGVESGAEQYMFGRLTSLYASADRIFVADTQVPVVRVYDHSGRFLYNLGRSGSGPGEYQGNNVLAVDAAGRVFLLDSNSARLNVYSNTGETLESWPMPSSRCCAWPIYPGAGGGVFAPVQEWVDRERSERRFGVRALGPDGWYGDVTWLPDIDYQESLAEVREGFEVQTPFSAWLLWNPTPAGGLLVGASDRYRFQVVGPGDAMLVVERFWEPTPVPGDQKEWERRRTMAMYRRTNPEFTIDPAQIPDHQPAYAALIPAISGETWVRSYGPSERLTDCAEDPLTAGSQEAYERPCWTNQWTIDVFGEDGRYLGEVELPDGLRPSALTLFADGRLVVAAIEDADGTIMVKRYRLVLPGEEEDSR